jgi:hypothetical protein
MNGATMTASEKSQTSEIAKYNLPPDMMASVAPDIILAA